MVRKLLACAAARLTYSNIVATAAIFVALGGGAYALTAPSGSAGVVKACVNKRTGAVRIVRKNRCKKRERRITWNVRGVQGPKGDAGNQGVPGVPGSIGATGAQGPAPAAPVNIVLLSENWGTFGSPNWTNQPAGLTELFGNTSSRLKADLGASTQVRLLTNVSQAGAATSAMRVQYSTDQTSWSYLDGSSGPSVSINTTGLKVSSWVDVASGAKSDVFLRVVGINGDGTADPSFGNLVLQVR